MNLDLTKLEQGLYHITYSSITRHRYPEGWPKCTLQWEILGRYTGGWVHAHEDRILHFEKLVENLGEDPLDPNPMSAVFRVQISRFNDNYDGFVIKKVSMRDLPLYVGFDKVYRAFEETLKDG